MKEIQSLNNQEMQDALMAEERALFSVFLRMLDENALPGEIKELIRAGNWAQGAVRNCTLKTISRCLRKWKMTIYVNVF